MTEPNNHILTDNQSEETLNSLRNEIASLKFRLTKKDDRLKHSNFLQRLRYFLPSDPPC
jgi:hypothetical protein